MGVNGQPTSVEIVLLAVPAELKKVYVTTEPQGRLRGFYERRQQRATFAKFMEQDEIRRMGPPQNASDLLRAVPGVHISTNPTAGGNAIRIRNCQPMVLVDGQRIPGAELDEVVVPGDIAAIEFYPSSAGVPAQFLERGNRLCGLILVWTKAE
jgi:outer membrane receptor for ferrienterochelin and colicin